MAIRFQRSTTIETSPRVNTSKDGHEPGLYPIDVALSAGPGGGRIRPGLLGTGSPRNHKLGSKKSRRRRRSRQALSAAKGPPGPLFFRLNSNSGQVDVLNGQGATLDKATARLIKRENSELLQAWLFDQSAKINARIRDLGRLHEQIPATDDPLALVLEPFTETEPDAPAQENIRWADLLIPWRSRQVARRKKEAQRRYEFDLARWTAQRKAHENRENIRATAIEDARGGLHKGMNDLFQLRVEDIDWPYETHVYFGMPDSARLVIDVDLPEIDSLCLVRAGVKASGKRLSLKHFTERARRETYRDHIHSVSVLLIGLAFQCMPAVRHVTLSGFSQRCHELGTHIRDDYLLSVRLDREDWARLDFTEIEKLNPVGCLAMFDLKRDMTETCVFRPIEPFT